MEDKAPRPDRAERRRNGPAKLVPTLKPWNGLNDSWRVGGWRPFQPRFNPTPARLEARPPYLFLFSRLQPPIFAVAPCLRAVEGSREGRREDVVAA